MGGGNNDDPLSGSSGSGGGGGGEDEGADRSAIAAMKLAESRRLNNETARQTALDIHEKNLHTPWQIKKQQIMKEYAVDGTLTLNSDAITEFDGSGVEDGSATRHLDQYARRLANLERRQVSSSKVDMTQEQYVEHVQKLSQDLNRAWANDERVGSLKIAIQLAKLLADTNMPQFYPCMFVLVTDVLERFGEMVFTRLKAKAEEALNDGAPDRPFSKKKTTLPEDFTSAQVPTSTKETCRNWFYKTACIRELMPRAYVEITLLKCYRFLTDQDYPQILSRLGSIIRGLGDPLVSLYVYF